MAYESPVQVPCEEMTCSICLDYFKDPVVIDCGHTFCQACINECCGKSGVDAFCPQCRQSVQAKNFRVNRQLASIVEAAKRFSLHRLQGAEASGPVCERHQEPLKLFCQDDEVLICVVCDKAKEHREHNVIPKEEAFEECKGRLQTYLEFLEKERESILSSQQSGENEGQSLLEQTETERQKIMAGFKQLHQFLEEQENCLLAELKGLEDQIKGMLDVHMEKLCEELSSVDLLIKETEEKQKQPASEFLQDIKNLLQRCDKEKFVNPVAFPPELMQDMEKFSESSSFLDIKMKEFKDTVLAGPQAQKAIPTLVLSVYCPNNSQGGYYRPTTISSVSCWSYIMGVERITSGSCSWETNVMDAKFWAVGVALECVRGTNSPALSPEKGICAVGKSTENLWYAFISSEREPISCPWSTNSIYAHRLDSFNTVTIRVSLNHKRGSVTFFNSFDNSIIYTFRNVSFSGQPVSSWFLRAN